MRDTESVYISPYTLYGTHNFEIKSSAKDTGGDEEDGAHEEAGDNDDDVGL